MVSGPVVAAAEHDSCHICWAAVPRALMHFHREWHREQEESLQRIARAHSALAVAARNAAVPGTVVGACPPE